MSSRVGRTRGLELALAALALTLSAGPVRAQEPAPPAPQPPAAADSVTLVFDREVFDYTGSSRRDPFTPLTGKNAMGPRFQDLKLTGIIYTPVAPHLGVATIQDATGQRHRVRRGDVVGNTRILEIGARRVRVVVSNFGQERQETLELKKDGEGTSR